MKGWLRHPFFYREETTMEIFDVIRIKRKIRMICKVFYQLSKSDQAECMNIVITHLRITDDWRMKEQFLDMILEGFDALCL